MEYQILRNWVREYEKNPCTCKDLSRFEDQFFISFKKGKQVIQINLLNDDPFLFTTEEKELLSEETPDLHTFNTHLKQASLYAIDIHESDRIVFMHFQKYNIYNALTEYTLILELIPRYANIILCRIDNDKKIILDALRKVTMMENRQRQILAGLVWLPPDTTFKSEDKDKGSTYIIQDRKLIVTEKGTIQDVNTALSTYFYNVLFQKRVDALRASLLRQVQKKSDKAIAKLEKYKNDLQSTEAEQQWYQYAELLKANYHLLQRGMDAVSITNYFHDAFPTIEIPLLIDQSPQQNIERYFKRYKKAKSGKAMIQQQIELIQNSIDELEAQCFDIEHEEDYMELKLYLANPEKKKDKQSISKKYKRIFINAEWELIIGRTSKENDQLTCKIAKPEDWWFHTRIFQGSHVILRNFKKQVMPENYLYIAARLAAYYSKAKSSSNVPVDYTQIRYVRKPRSSPPGYVIYTNQKTIFVEPLSFKEAIKSLAIKDNITKK